MLGVSSRADVIVKTLHLSIIREYFVFYPHFDTMKMSGFAAGPALMISNEMAMAGDGDYWHAVKSLMSLVAKLLS